MSHAYKSERGCRLRRRIRRLQLGANRKSTAVRWIGSWTVGVQVPCEGGQRGRKVLPKPRKTRRGQRGGASGLARLAVTKEVARLLVSAVRNAAPRHTSALDEKTRSSRVVNHKGRKFLWAVKAANRIAARNPAPQLMKEVPSDFGHLSRSQARATVKRLGVGETNRWELFSRRWHLYSYKCRHMGAPTEGSNPLHFLCLRAPHVGGLDLMDLLDLSGLRPADPLPPPRLVNAVCRSCGYVGPSGTHADEDCRRGASTVGRVAPPTRRRGWKGVRRPEDFQ